MIVTRKELADFLDVSERWISQLQKEKIISKNREAGGYDLKECSRAYWENRLKTESGKKAAISKEQAQAEHERIKMDISKEKLRRLRRESLNASAVEASWTDMLVYFRNKLDALPQKIVMSIAGENINSQIGIVDNIIKDLEKELIDYDPKDVGYDITDEFYDDDEDEEEDEE